MTCDGVESASYRMIEGDGHRSSLGIVTINYNNACGLQASLDSVFCQSVIPDQLVVIDGNSNDGSLQVALDFQAKSSQIRMEVVSERDNGIYDAMTKGVKLLKTDFVMILNSGDRLYDHNVISKIRSAVKSLPETQAIYGNKFYSDKAGNISRSWKPGRFHRMKYLLGWMTPHLATVISRDCYLKFGSYDSRFKIAGDYDFMLRVFYFGRVKPIRTDIDVVIMEAGGVSNGSFSGLLQSNWEVLMSWRKYTPFIPFWIFFTKPLSKVSQLGRGKS